MPDNVENKYERLRQLIQGMLTGSLTEDEFQVLDRMMSDDPECLKYYIEYTTIWALLDETECMANTAGLPEYKALPAQVRQEQMSIPKTKPEFKTKAGLKKHLFQFVKWKPGRDVPQTKNSKTQFTLLARRAASIVLSTAAVLFVVLLIKLFSHQKLYNVDIVTIADQINAQWDPETPLEIGSRLGVNEMQLSLKKGAVKLRFNDNVYVLIEGPAVFKIDQTGLFLDHGSVYCMVTRPALGFTVKTSSAAYIDLGTVFGIKSDSKGVSELHVFKGNVRMIAGLAGNFRFSKVVKENNAVRYNSQRNIIEAIPIEQNGFVSHFDSESKVIQKGQMYIELADIVGGGNGLGTGTDQTGINPIIGRMSGLIAGTQRSANDFHSVPSSPYIDGVFVPNGRTKQIISSQGNLFVECPVTSGSCFNNIGYGMRSIGPNRDQLLRSILLHANTGITFDLEAIRRLMPETGTIRFRSQIAIERSPFRPKASNADFWVLVDGKLKFKKTQVKHGSFYSVDVELSRSDRFLTLIVTDGGDPENRIIDGETVSAIDSDWGMFAEPVLVAE